MGLLKKSGSVLKTALAVTAVGISKRKLGDVEGEYKSVTGKLYAYKGMSAAIKSMSSRRDISRARRALITAADILIDNRIGELQCAVQSLEIRASSIKSFEDFASGMVGPKVSGATFDPEASCGPSCSCDHSSDETLH